MIRRRTIWTGACLALVCTSAFAGDIAVCGASSGYAYYPRIGLTAGSNEVGKWTDDQISNGRITLTAHDDGSFDLLAADAKGGVYSAVNDGAEVFQFSRSIDSLIIIVAYPVTGVIETYNFLKSVTGPEVMWTSNKGRTPVLKAGTYRAECSFIDLS